MSSKKLSQLQEKVTSLSADDLLYVSVNGESKSIKASTVEAPLKAYADQKKSEVLSELQTLDGKISTEITNRQAADTTTLNNAKAYTNSQIASEQVARSLDDAATLSSANAYADSAVEAEQSLRVAGDAVLDQKITDNYDTMVSEFSSVRGEMATDRANASQTYATKTAVAADIASASQSTLAQADANLQAEVAALQQLDALNIGYSYEYTDTKVAMEETARIAADATTLNSANAYTDLTCSNTLNSAKTYTDSSATATLSSAKSYTDSAIAAIPASSGSVPSGVIQMYAGSTAPTGYLLCDGSAVSRTTYSALFSVIGTSYGVGNGTSTFNLPNPDGNVNIRYIIKI